MPHINWLWLLIGIAAGMYLIPMVMGMLGKRKAAPAA